jgi:ribonuclease P protein component
MAAACQRAGVPDQSFPPAARFHHGRDYSRVFQRAQKAAGRWCVLMLRPRGRGPGKTTAPPGRLGVMVPVKAVKLAVDRHAIKRWAREWFRCAAKERLAGFDALVLLRSGPPDHRACATELAQLLDRALAAKAEARPPRQRR